MTDLYVCVYEIKVMSSQVSHSGYILHCTGREEGGGRRVTWEMTIEHCLLKYLVTESQLGSY